MLNVWSVCTGHKYSPAYVYALRDAVALNLSAPHNFLCLTDQPDKLPGIDWVYLQSDLSGWWNKLHLFDLAYGPTLYFDLDVIIVDDLNYLVPYTRSYFSAPANWAQSGHGGIQSSVMAWDGNGYMRHSGIYEKFVNDAEQYRARLWGDQEYLTEVINHDRWTTLPHIFSYKYHCRQTIPRDASVIVCHGKPDPHEIHDEWILRYTSTLRSRIKWNMANGSSVDSHVTA